MDQDECFEANTQTKFGLRLGGLFVVLVTSFVGTLAPIVLKKRKWCPLAFFEFAKYFGSGVIISTAFVHLLAPAFDLLSSPCLGGAWANYNWASAIAMLAVYFIFFVEFAAYRVGTSRMRRLKMRRVVEVDGRAGVGGEGGGESGELEVDALGHRLSRRTSNLPVRLDEEAHTHSTATALPLTLSLGLGNLEAAKSTETLETADFTADVTPEYDTTTTDGVAQLIAVGILEFGVIMHSVFIGLTLVVNEEFTTLFVVIVFHQMFEGLGVGSRLSALRLPPNLRWTPYFASFLYSITTPIGMAIGLGLSSSYNRRSQTTMAVEGVLHALSAGILLYTGLVELLAHEILFNPKMTSASVGKVTYIFTCILVGSGIMALIGYWA
ncbi:hypothetical protein FFLO_04766 [Filobasidium floriforme]|uniref:ZIP zinc/iron transport family n=1 Tax=Filobasidium floriforme TaxID=5210 RepID=A0A8K0JKC6_9TREE|nr:putative low-affinity zinc ion transporter [Filobasidium floriforme]KAG7530859.1 hypothetical protein FFLO_04766 [Filobasidium floriforme]KAH8082528.1 putative low-affinity zinc ion transporter [Filobasidium floriforme]